MADQRFIDLQPPAATQVTRVDYDRQTSRDDLHPDQMQAHVDTLQDLQRWMRYDAVITAISSEHSDLYVIDLYAGGFGTTKTHTNFSASASSPTEKFDVNNRVKVRFLPNGSLLILPPEIPTGNGFGLIYMNVDDAIPATRAFDFGRFTTPVATITF